MSDWLKRFLKPLQPGTIRSRLLITFVLMALLPAIGISLGSSLAGYYSSQSQSIDRLESVATLKQFEIKAWATSLENQLASAINEEYSSERASIILQLNSENRFSHYYYLAMRNRLDRFLERNQQFNELFLVDQDGHIILSTDVSNEGKVYDDLNNSQHLLSNPSVQFGYSPWASRQMIVIASLPVNDQNGKPIGSIAGLANLEPIKEILSSRTGLGNTGVTYLVNDKHVTVDPFFIPETLSPNGPTSSPLHTLGIDQATDEHISGAGVYNNLQGIRVIGVYQWLPEFHLALLNEQHLVETTQGIFNTLVLNTGIAFAAVVLAILASIFITRSIAIPIEDLAGTAQQIANGNLDQLAQIVRKDEIGSLAVAFNSMTAQLRDLINGLEQRVKERTQALQRRALQLEISAQVSRQITSILNIDDLLGRVVDLIRDAFSYSYVNIYLIDPDKHILTLRASTGELSPQFFNLEIGSGSLNGEAARANKPIVVNDVTRDARFLPDEQLSDTQAELVIPLRVADQVIGTLDVQSSQLAAFHPEDLMVIQSLGDQIAIAIENARLYERSLNLAVLEERNRIARELHDSVTQSLYSLSLLVEAWQRLSSAGRQVPIEDYLNQFGEITEQSLKEMRLLVYELRPPAIEKEGLLGALRQRLEAVEKRAGVEARLVVDELIELPAAVEEQTYWIAHEALNNALKHANATQVNIHIAAKDGEVTLEVSDNGQGFDVEKSKLGGGMGLGNMAERAKRIGGRLSIYSSPGQRTSVVLKVKVDEIIYADIPLSSQDLRKY